MRKEEFTGCLLICETAVTLSDQPLSSVLTLDVAISKCHQYSKMCSESVVYQNVVRSLVFRNMTRPADRIPTVVVFHQPFVLLHSRLKI